MTPSSRGPGDVETWDSRAMSPGSWAAEEIAKLVPEGTPVVKVFNTTVAGTLGSGAESSLRVSSEKGAGGRIAFLDDVKDVYVINADSSGLTKLTSHPGNDFDPSWSPDGRQIAFRSERDGNNEIYVMNADGSGQRQLTEIYGEYPDWSPDGRRIVFSGDRLDIVNVDGSKLTPLAIPGAALPVFPDWMP